MADAPQLPITGHCLCGGVGFEITDTPLDASYCHCTRCQRRTGTAASANLKPAPGSFRLTAGEELVRFYSPPDGFEKAFCSVCGSALFSRDPDDHQNVGVRMGALDSDPGIAPSSRRFVAYAAGWERIPDDGLPRYPENPPL